MPVGTPIQSTGGGGGQNVLLGAFGGASGGARSAASTTMPSTAGNPYTQWAGGQYSVIDAQARQQQSYYDLQGGQARSTYDQGVGALNAGYGFDVARLANDQRRLGADQALQYAQVGYTDRNSQLNNTRYDNQAQYLAALGALDRSRYTEQGNYLAQLLGLDQTRFSNVNQDIGNQRGINFRTFQNAQTTNQNSYDAAIRGAQLTLDRAQSAAMTDATTRGALLSQGYGETYGFNNRDYANSETAAKDTLGTSNDRANIGYDSRNFDLDASGRANQLQWDTDQTNSTHANFQNKLQYDTDSANRDQSRRSNELQWEQDKNSYALAQAQNTRNQEYLNATAKDYGIQGQQLADSLQRGIDKLGLDYSSTIAQLGNLSSQSSSAAQAQKQAITYALLNAAQTAGGSTSAVAGRTGSNAAQTIPGQNPSNTSAINVPGYPGTSRQTAGSRDMRGNGGWNAKPGVSGSAEPRVIDRDKNGNIIYDSSNPRSRTTAGGYSLNV